MTSIDDFILKYGKEDDEKVFERDKALVYLLEKKVLFSNTRPYIENPYDPKEKHIVSESATIVLFVNCSDTFVWGCADGIEIDANDKTDLETNELYRLTSYVIDNEKYGSDKFACWKRNLQPQKPVIDKMKKDGVWDEFMESLPKNPDSIEGEQ